MLALIIKLFFTNLERKVFLCNSSDISIAMSVATNTREPVLNEKVSMVAGVALAALLVTAAVFGGAFSGSTTESGDAAFYFANNADDDGIPKDVEKAAFQTEAAIGAGIAVSASGGTAAIGAACAF